MKNRDNLKKVVLVGGAFDIIHIGHVSHLKKAKSLGDTLVVHITSDSRVKEKKGETRPIFNVRQRALLVSAIKFVDYVFIYNGRHYDEEVIRKIKPDIIFFNKEAFNSDIKKKIKSIKDFEGRIVVSRERKTNSTTKIIDTLQGKVSHEKQE